MNIATRKPLPSLPEPAERRRLRELYGATQTEVAEHIGATRKMITAYERGTVTPAGTRRAKYADLLSSWARTESQVSAKLAEYLDPS